MNYDLVAKRPRLLQQIAGVTPTEFSKLKPKFEAAYKRREDERWEGRERKRASGGGRQGAIPGVENKLLFALVYMRAYPVLIIQGLLFGMAESCACEWAGVLVPVLEEALGATGVKPQRAHQRDLSDMIRDFPELVEIGVLIDGVERPVRRPKNQTKQKTQYSGKKKRHTTKKVAFAHPLTQYIIATTNERDGSIHEKRVIDEEEIGCSKKLRVVGDSGNQGVKLGEAEVVTPVKKKPHRKGQPIHELTKKEKAFNTALARERVPIEHSFAGFKRSRAAADVLRSTREGAGELFTIVAMGLHNLRVITRSTYLV